jgi:alanine racemase
LEQNTHRVWAEIHLDAIEHNFRAIVQYTGGCPILAVVKADAYGHGSVPVAQRLEKAGASWFAVATVPEALKLRRHGITKPVLILGYVSDADAPLLAQYDIAAPVYDEGSAQAFSRAAQQAGKPIHVHFALDTGMTRIGLSTAQPQHTVQQIAALAGLPGLVPEGLFTHFAVSDTLSGKDFTLQQMERFQAVASGLAQAGIHIPLRHCANSGGVLQYKDGYFDIVRAGIILYGYHPDISLPHVLDLRPAMTLKARVVQVRDALPGSTVSYGRTYTVPHPMRVAVLSIGYADGLLRTASGKAQVLIDGKKAPVLGRICMDMCMAQVPEGAAIKRGDSVTIFGDGALTANDFASAAGTISYEALCAVSARVPRIYL